MPLHPFEPPRGRVERVRLRSRALEGNLIGDPAERDVAVYLPENYDEAGPGYPLFVGLASFTGSGLKMLGWRAFGESVPQRLDRLVASGAMAPVILALPDAFTSLGGNQYLDGPALGGWASFLVEEMVPEIERRFHVRPGRRHRAIFGRSSGGYGALVHGMTHAETWGAVACHSGDMAFDLVYRRDLPAALDALARHGGEPTRFVAALRDAERVSGDDFSALMVLAMAATYDPDPAAPLGIRLPVDPHTCEILPERWERWLAHDPLRLVERDDCRENLRRLSGLWIDCGRQDEYGLHYGARSLARALTRHGIAHVHEEYEGVHSGGDARFDRSLPFLARAIAG